MILLKIGLELLWTFIAPDWVKVILEILGFELPIESMPLEENKTLEIIGIVFFFSTTPWTKFNDFNKISLLTINCISITVLVKDF